MYSLKYSYDDLSRVSKQRFTAGDNTSTVTYTYNTNNQPDTLKFTNINQEYGYNGIGILNSKTIQMNDGTDLINYNYYYHDSERNEMEVRYTEQPRSGGS